MSTALVFEAPRYYIPAKIVGSLQVAQFKTKPVRAGNKNISSAEIPNLQT